MTGMVPCHQVPGRRQDSRVVGVVGDGTDLAEAVAEPGRARRHRHHAPGQSGQPAGERQVA
ncbi:hypothetical protein OG350_36590 [Streptomyces achromogenes]|uniref:Uncharacterized protein n=1 Tax=Streptomyces achromogenes TaxID=67255 RepID=A0ABZ1KZN1_STRAH